MRHAPSHFWVTSSNAPEWNLQSQTPMRGHPSIEPARPFGHMPASLATHSQLTHIQNFVRGPTQNHVAKSSDLRYLWLVSSSANLSSLDECRSMAEDGSSLRSFHGQTNLEPLRGAKCVFIRDPWFETTNKSRFVIRNDVSPPCFEQVCFFQTAAVTAAKRQDSRHVMQKQTAS